MNDLVDTPDRDPNPPDPPEYCEGGQCDACTIPYYQCPGTEPVTCANEDDEE